MILETANSLISARSLSRFLEKYSAIHHPLIQEFLTHIIPSEEIEFLRSFTITTPTNGFSKILEKCFHLAQHLSRLKNKPKATKTQSQPPVWPNPKQWPPGGAWRHPEPEVFIEHTFCNKILDHLTSFQCGNFNFKEIVITGNPKAQAKIRRVKSYPHTGVKLVATIRTAHARTSNEEKRLSEIDLSDAQDFETYAQTLLRFLMDTMIECKVHPKLEESRANKIVNKIVTVQRVIEEEDTTFDSSDSSEASPKLEKSSSVPTGTIEVIERTTPKPIPSKNLVGTSAANTSKSKKKAKFFMLKIFKSMAMSQRNRIELFKNQNPGIFANTIYRGLYRNEFSAKMEETPKILIEACKNGFATEHVFKLKVNYKSNVNQVKQFIPFIECAVKGKVHYDTHSKTFTYTNLYISKFDFASCIAAIKSKNNPKGLTFNELEIALQKFIIVMNYYRGVQHDLQEMNHPSGLLEEFGVISSLDLESSSSSSSGSVIVGQDPEEEEVLDLSSS